MPTITSDPIEALVADDQVMRWNAPDGLETATVVTYAFSEGEQLSVPWDSDLETPSASVRTIANAAFRDLESFTNLRFVEVTGSVNADIELKIGGTPASGQGWLPYVTEFYKTDSIILLNDGYFDQGQTLNDWHQWVIYHEIGHTLGLKHPHEEDAGNPSVLTPALDTSINTVMSYVDAGFVGYAPFDRTALQYLYGDGTAPASVSFAWDDAVGALVHGGGAATGDMHLLTNAPDAMFARSGDDTLRGFGGADLLYGNQGADTISGGSGDDTLYGGQNGDAWDEIWSGLGDDLAYGNRGSDLLDGYDGADTLYGGQENDYVRGGAGDDVLFGNRGDDTLAGGAGADVLVFAGGGNDVVEAAGFNADEGDRLSIPGGVTGVGNDASGNLVLEHSLGQVTLIGVTPASYSDGWLV